ncbi:MAG: sigma-70 family RNA polymerase sigma factor [Bryobacterales bacterium]|nr:sigma-70 family RNA polymerase sigma factor [Bryobacterales bacterium]
MTFHSFDRDYVDSLIAGNPDVEQHFTDYFGELLFIKLRMRVRSPQMREDVVQETFLRVLAYLRKTGGLDHPERLGAFVNTVCTNVVLEHFRAESRSAELPEHMADPPDFRPDTESRLVTEESRVEVRRVLESLPPKDRDLLRKIFLEERGKDEVCSEMKVDRDYLRVLLHRAKARLKEGLLRSRTAGAA